MQIGERHSVFEDRLCIDGIRRVAGVQSDGFLQLAVGLRQITIFVTVRASTKSSDPMKKMSGRLLLGGLGQPFELDRLVARLLQILQCQGQKRSLLGTLPAVAAVLLVGLTEEIECVLLVVPFARGHGPRHTSSSLSHLWAPAPGLAAPKTAER